MTSSQYNVMTVVGARPQFVKAAPLSRALAATGRIFEILVHTGQHFDANMSDVFFSELDIPPPARNLHIHGGGHGGMTGRMMYALEEAMAETRPDAVVVFGDTNSTLAAALVAAKMHVPIAHIEAGVRSFNRRMPEEINRIATDVLSDLLLSPSPNGVENLRREGVRGEVLMVGDLMFDATLEARERALGRSDIMERLGLQDRGFVLCTVHRAENTDDPARFDEIADYVGEAARERPVIWPVHPRTRALVTRRSFAGDVRLVDPLGYLDMHRLLDGCESVLTDSGGVQKEAYFHGRRCVTLRSETEWVETVECGWNRLWRGPDYTERRPIEHFGSGRAATVTAEALVSFLDRRGAAPSV